MGGLGGLAADAVDAGELDRDDALGVVGIEATSGSGVALRLGVAAVGIGSGVAMRSGAAASGVGSGVWTRSGLAASGVGSGVGTSSGMPVKVKSIGEPGAVVGEAGGVLMCSLVKRSASLCIRLGISPLNWKTRLKRSDLRRALRYLISTVRERMI